MSWSQLKSLLKVLKFYKNLKNTLGKRGIEIFHQKMYHQAKYVVEYYPILDKKIVQEMAMKTYDEVFGETVDVKNILLFAREDLEGWIKVYKNHEMLDLSLSRIKKCIGA